MSKAKSSSNKLRTTEDVKKLALKKETIVHIETDNSSQEAMMGTKYVYSRKSKILTIVVSLLDENEKEAIFEVIRKIFNNGGIIWKLSKEDALESYQNYSQQNSGDRKILEFFKGILSQADFNALKLALYLRHEKDTGANISVSKKEIRERFGERGANIANLCTAGYFENEFMPLYNQLAQKDFYEYYELAVGEKARALFVHKGMSVEDMEFAFQEMLNKAVKYHMSDFRIHGMGKQNVDMINEFVAIKTSNAENNFFIKKEYEKLEPSVVGYIVKITTE